MNKNMKIVIDFLIKSESEIFSLIEELEGDFESISDEIYNAYHSLTELEKYKVFRFVFDYKIKNY